MSIYIKKSICYGDLKTVQWHGMVCCHLIWYEPHTIIIGGKYLFTLGNLFVKAAGMLCSNMGWFAVIWSDMNIIQLL